MLLKGCSFRCQALALLLLFCSFCVGSNLHAETAAVQLTRRSDSRHVVTIRTPEGMHRFELVPRKLSTLIIPSAQPAKVPGLYVGSDQRHKNARLAGSIYAKKLSLVFSGKNSGRIYTATLACLPLSRECQTSVRRIASNYKVSCHSHSTKQPITAYRQAGETSLDVQSRELSIAAHLDANFVRQLGDNSEAEVISILNAVEVIYLSQLGVHLRITTLERVMSPVNPLGSSNAEVLLDQYVRYYTRAHTLERANVHHLFTGKDLYINDEIGDQRLEGIVGLAFIGSTCRDPELSASLSQLTDAQLGLRTIITAHEIAHNLNATHPEESGLPSETAGIMSAVVTAVNTTFSQFSLNEILPYLSSNGECLADAVPQIEIEQASRDATALSVSLSADADFSSTCQVTLFASSRKRMLNAEIKTNRVITVAQAFVTTPDTIELSGALRKTAQNAPRVYVRAMIECESGIGLSRVAAVGKM